MSMIPHIIDETSPLETVILGTAVSMGETPSAEDCYDPKSREHVLAGTFPIESDLMEEMDSMSQVLQKHGVEVLRPEALTDVNQIFSRDICFVIDDLLHVANVIEDRQAEIQGIQHILTTIDSDHIVHLPKETQIEGGDVMPWRDHLFVGYSEQADFDTFTTSRTNREGLDYLKEAFPAKTVHGFELNKSDTVARDNALHLDCCFQPIGVDMGIIYKGGFKNPEDVDYIEGIFGRDNLIEISREEMYHMFSNIFSINEETIVSNSTFTRLNEVLRAMGFEVEEVPYSEISKMEGLFRCTTMPIIRG